MRIHYSDKIFRGSGTDWDARVRKGRAPRDIDDLPTKVGMTDAHRRGWHRKEPSHSHSFANRWLRSQAGRPWNAVWSEICAMADRRSTVADAIRSTFDSCVERDIRREADGRLVEVKSYGVYDATGLCVDPEGILRFIPRSRIQKWEPARKHVVLSDRCELHRIDGVWFEIHFDILPPVTLRSVHRRDGTPCVVADDPGAWDVLERVVANRRGGWRNPVSPRDGDQEREIYAKTKRTLSSSDLRKHGLVNEMAAPR